MQTEKIQRYAIPRKEASDIDLRRFRNRVRAILAIRQAQGAAAADQQLARFRKQPGGEKLAQAALDQWRRGNRGEPNRWEEDAPDA